MPESSSETTQKCAGILLAAAVREIFPKAKLAGGDFDGYGFYYDFFLPDPLDETALRFIEDRLFLLIGEKASFSSHEMIGENARQMFKLEKQFERGKQLENQKGLVSLVRFKNFWDASKPPYLEHSGEIKAIKLLGVKNESIWIRGKKSPVARIFGLAASSKGELKEKIKNRKSTLENSHLKVGKAERLFIPLDKEPGCIWTEKGLETLNIIRKRLINTYLNHEVPLFDLSALRKWKSGTLQKFEDEELFSLFSNNNLPNSFFEFLTFEGDSYEEPKGLYKPYFYEQDLAHLFCGMEKLQREITSSLQFIEENVNISGIESNWQFARTGSGKPEFRQIEQLFEAALKKALVKWEDVESETEIPRASLVYKDVFGGFWSGPFVEVPKLVNKTQDLAVIRYSLLGSLEKFLAFCLERHKKLPFSLQTGSVGLQNKTVPPQAESFSSERTFGSDEGVERDAKERITEALRTESVPLFLRDQRRYNKD